MAWEKLDYATQDTTMPAMICIVDELASFLNTTERSEMRLVDKFQSLVQEISAIGRSANVHVILCTQSATGDLFPQRLKNNVKARFICGRVEANVSRMAIDSEEGESIPKVPGSYLGWMDMETQPFQGYFTQLEEVLALGTVKEGYDPKTGLLIEVDDEDSPYEGPSLVDSGNEEDVSEEDTLEGNESEEEEAQDLDKEEDPEDTFSFEDDFDSDDGKEEVPEERHKRSITTKKSISFNKPKTSSDSPQKQQTRITIV